MKGDTVYWKQNFIPQFKQIIHNSKPQAVKNLTFKTSFGTGTRDYNEQEIADRNRIRLQKDCNIQDENKMHGCNHYQAYCALHVSTETLGAAMESFSTCALYRNRVCGESFQDPKDIENNLAELDQAFAEISKIKEEMGKDPVMNEYMSDVYDAYQKIADLLEEAKKNKLAALAQLGKERKAGDLSEKEMDALRKQTLENMGNDIDRKELALRKSDDGFRKASEVLNACDDYLEKKGYDDDHNIISQVNICSSPNTDVVGKQLEDFTNVVDHMNKAEKFQSLKELTLSSIDNAIDLTVQEFASTYKAINGNKPTESQMCQALGQKFCNAKAKSSLQKLNIDNVSMMNYQKEMDEFNASAAKMNSLCTQIKNGENPVKVESEIQRQLTKVMYETRIGQLMAFKKFRDVIKPFDQEACYKKGAGFARLTSKDLLAKGLQGVLSLQKDKARQLADYESQVGYHVSAMKGQATSKDYDKYQNLLMKFLENDPYTVRRAIRASGKPDHALLLCKATADIYRDEKTQRVWNWIGTGVCIAGSLAATVFTGGAAAPLLIASIAAGTSMGVYNLDRAMTRQHNKEMSQAIISADPYLNSLEMKAADEEVKAAYVEIAMNFLPGAIKGLKAGTKMISPMMKSSKLVGPILSGAGDISAKLGANGKTLLTTLKAGGEVTQEMIQKALGEKLAKASGKAASMLGDLIRGAAPDAALEMATAIALHPDPLSEGSVQAMLKGVAMGVAFEKLGAGGRNLVMKYKNAKLKTTMASVHHDVDIPKVDTDIAPVQKVDAPKVSDAGPGLEVSTQKQVMPEVRNTIPVVQKNQTIVTTNPSTVTTTGPPKKTYSQAEANDYFNSFDGKQKQAWDDFKRDVDFDKLPLDKQNELLSIMYSTHKSNNGVGDKVEVGKMRDLVEVQNFLKANGIDPTVARNGVRNLASSDVKILGESPALDKYSTMSGKDINAMKADYKADPTKAQHLQGEYEALLLMRKEALSKGDMKLKKKIDEELEMIKVIYPKTADLDAIALNVKNGTSSAPAPAPKVEAKPITAQDQSTIKDHLNYSSDNQFQPLANTVKTEANFSKKDADITKVETDIDTKMKELAELKTRVKPGSDDDIRISNAMKNLEGQKNLMKGMRDDMNRQLDYMRGTVNEVKTGKLAQGTVETKVDGYNNLSQSERTRLGSEVDDNLNRLKRMKQHFESGNLNKKDFPGVDVDAEIKRLQSASDKIHAHDYFNGLSGKQGEAMNSFRTEMNNANIPPARQNEILVSMHQTHTSNNQASGVAMGKKRDLVDVQNLLITSGMDPLRAREQVRTLASNDLRILGENPIPGSAAGPQRMALGPDDFNTLHSDYHTYDANHPVLGHIKGEFDYLDRDGFREAKLKSGMHSIEGVEFLKRVRPEIADQISVQELPNGVMIAELPEAAFYTFRFNQLSKRNITTKMVNGREVRFTKKSLFPKTWTDADVLKAIDKIKNDQANLVEVKGDSKKFQGTYNNVEIELIVSGNGSVPTAYPLIP